MYIRQSTPDQVKYNLESKRLQYGLAERARALGWQDVEVIDDELGISDDGTRRPGFERLLCALCDGQVGAVFSIEASRLARNCREWHTLLKFCSIVGAPLIDAEAIYDPRLTNDQLLLGMKGTFSAMEVATFRERAQAALLQKAQRGALDDTQPVMRDGMRIAALDLEVRLATGHKETASLLEAIEALEVEEPTIHHDVPPAREGSRRHGVRREARQVGLRRRKP